MTATPLPPEPAAAYTLSIAADTGYESTTEGRCNVQQYAVAVRALHDAAWAKQVTEGQQAAPPDELHNFLDAAAGEGLVLGGVDAADLYITLFPQRYAAAIAQQKGQQP